MARITKASTALPGTEYTRTEAEELAADITALQLEKESLIVRRDEAILAASEPFAGQLDIVERRIKSDLEILENWAESHQAEFGKGESILLSGHRCGWRLGNHAAKLLRGWTWKKTIDALSGLSQDLQRRYLRLKVDANKDLMITDRDDPAAVAILRQIGVTIVQERRFYLDPAREGQDDKTLRSDTGKAA